MRIAILSLSLVSTLAFADGSPLFDPPTRALTTAETQRVATMRARPEVADAQAFAFNRFAVDAGVITVSVGGKECRVAGQKREAPGGYSWSGQNETCGIFLTIDKAGHVAGSVLVGPRSFNVQTISPTVAMLSEWKPTPDVLEATPEMRAAWRAASASASNPRGKP